MMRGIFCHDLPVYKDVNGVYCSTTLTDDLFQRYFQVVDELVVAVRVYSLNVTYQEAHQERITLPGIRFMEIPNLNTPRGLFSLIPKYKRLLQEEMKVCDLVFIRGGIIATMGVDCARKLHKPYLIECAGAAWESYWHHSMIGKLIAPYMEFRARKDIREASAVIYVTEHWLQRRYPTKGIYTHASNVILQEIPEDSLLKRLAKLRGKEVSGQLVLGTTAGVDNKAKGQQFVIRILPELMKQYNVRYELVGGGDAKYLLSVARQCGVEDRVIFMGQLTHDQVLDWLDSIDLYVQPSMQEGLPRALIEAMSRACPSVGSSTAGIPELLEKDAVFKRGNLQSLLNTLKKILGSDLSARAEVNFVKAQEYGLDKLDKRRKIIYEQYREIVEKKQ